jgi:hypothetical protein
VVLSPALSDQVIYKASLKVDDWSADPSPDPTRSMYFQNDIDDIFGFETVDNRAQEETLTLRYCNHVG